MQSKSPSKHLVGLDLIRFASAALVMVFHLGYWSWAAPRNTAFRAAGGAVRFPELEAFASCGWVGVEVFFVLSGFVIAQSAERASPIAFFRSRALRLLPAIWVCATITLLAAYGIGLEPIAELIKRYVKSVILHHSGPWIDGVYWTLLVEVAFYVLIFLALLANQFKRLELIALLLGGFSAAFWLLPPLQQALLRVVGGWEVNLLLAKHGCFFALGIMLWIISVRRSTAWRLAVVAMFVAVGLVEIGDSTGIVQRTSGRPVDADVARIIWLCMVAAIAASIRWRDALGRALQGHGATIRAIGLMTYPLYLIHQLAGGAVLRVAFIGMPQYAALALSMASSIVVSWLVVRFAEPWLKARLGWLLDRVTAIVARYRVGDRMLRPTVPMPR